MTDPNVNFRRCWAYETTPRTTSITAVDSTTYKFGRDYGEIVGSIKDPGVSQPTENLYIYGKRTPDKIVLKPRKFEIVKERFCPTTIQFAVDILKKVTDGTPITVDPSDSGLNYPKTIRHEFNEGTNPRHSQYAGCYCIAASIIGAATEPLVVELDYIPSKIYDEGDYSMLTTAPSNAGGLSDANDSPFDGNPKVTYDSGDSAVVLSEVTIAETIITQNYYTMQDDSKNLTQTVYLKEFNKIGIILTAPFKTSSLWNDLIDRDGTKEMTIEYFKSNGTTYCKIALTNVVVIGHPTDVKLGNDIFLTQCSLVAEDIQITGTKQVETFATHFKGEVA